jgi:PAS domain S-box-containing protein
VSPNPGWSDAPGWRDFLDLLADAVIVLDRGARVVFANTAALRLLPCDAGLAVDQLQASLGPATIAWLKRAASGADQAAAPPKVRLADGRVLTLAWRRLDARNGALHLAVPHATDAASGAPPVRHEWAGPETTRETVRAFWDAPFPALLQDAQFRILDVNPAFLDFCGFRREQIVGHDVKDFQPREDWALILARRAGAEPNDDAALIDGRLVDANGRERPYRTARRTLVGEHGETLYLAVLQDATAEHVARERADRSLREIDDWFDLSPVGMVLFDERGLLLRTNPAFDALVGSVPVSLADAPPGLAELLAIDADVTAVGAPTAGESPEPPVARLHREGWVTPEGGAPRPLRALVRGYRTAGGRRRYMAVVQDRSIEEERDLAQTQIGALIDTAGIGLATFQESSGWVRQRHASQRTSAAPSAALQAIGRDVVEPESMADFERLQNALRRAERAEVRYAIRHPDLGQRWLLTRVEPATLASGKRTTSVVTLDITEQQQSQQRSEQLLRELSTILESTTAGIAYLRGDVLLRCNRRFEAMLGFRRGSMQDADAQRLLTGHPEAQRIAAEAGRSLLQGRVYETEIDLGGATVRPRGRRWYSLSVRRTGPSGGPVEAIAVLADVTRLKHQQSELELLARDRELMFSLSGVGIAFVRGGRVQRANPALAQLTGCSVEELSQLPLAALYVDEAEHAGLWPYQERELRERGAWTGERRINVRGGRPRWVEVAKRLVTAGDPESGFIASYVDVDARHRAERAVTLQAERTRSILDSVLVGIVTVGPAGIDWMNRSARRMFGGALADFVGQPIATVATDDPAHPFLRTDYLATLVEGQAETFECRVRARDGREFWIVGNVVSTGRQLTYALLDIERRREAEARMSQAQLELRRVIDAAPLAITLRDADTLKIIQVNGVAAGSAGTTPAELIGRTPEEMFNPALAAGRRADMVEALASPGVTQREYQLDRDGETSIWDARYIPLTEQPGERPNRLLLVATDITEQRAAEAARLEAAVAQRDMLVKEVHHRIKNNLQGVAGLLQQIAQRKPEVAGPISEVVSQVQAIAQVYGLQVGSSGPLQLAGVAEAIAASVQRTFGRTIRFSVRGACAPEWLLPEAESIPIALTLNELLTNAVKHSSAHGAPSGADIALDPDAEAGDDAGDADDTVRCLLDCDVDRVALLVSNRATLPPGFGLQRIPSGVSGLGLVRALLPRRTASLTLAQQGERVVATVTLLPPSVTREGASAAA